MLYYSYHKDPPPRPNPLLFMKAPILWALRVERTLRVVAGAVRVTADL